MGASSACKIFERFSDALAHILRTHYAVKHVKVLDDFLFIGETRKECQHALDAFLSLCKKTGIPIASHKTQDPTNSLTFLGIHIDTVHSQISIPLSKISLYKLHVQELLTRDCCTFRELKSIIGKLQFVSLIIPSGRCFLRRLHDATIGHKSPHAKIKLSNFIVLDLTTWLLFLNHYNGKQIISIRSQISANDAHIYTDSSLIGYGATYKGHYLYGTFPESWKSYDIQVLELYPIYLIITLFAKDFKDSSITLHSDNLAVVHSINNQTSKNANLMTILRKLVLILLQFNILCNAVHISGIKNNISDALSRLQVPKAINLLQQLGYHPHPIIVPDCLRPSNWKTLHPN